MHVHTYHYDHIHVNVRLCVFVPQKIMHMHACVCNPVWENGPAVSWSMNAIVNTDYYQ